MIARNKDKSNIKLWGGNGRDKEGGRVQGCGNVKEEGKNRKKKDQRDIPN